MRTARLISVLFVFVLVCGMLLAVVPLQAGAATSTSGDYEFTTSGGDATITKYIGTGGDVKIPSMIAGYNVTAIGANAF